MKKMAILLVGMMLILSALYVAGNTGKIEKLRFGVKNGDCKSIVYMNPNAISAINTRTSIDTDRGKLSIDPTTKALYDEQGNLVATRLSNSEYIPAGFDKNMDGILRGEEAAVYSRYQFSQFSGNSNVRPTKALWDAYLQANRKWTPAGIDNPYTHRDESMSVRELSPADLQKIYLAIGAVIALLAGALALWFWWRR